MTFADPTTARPSPIAGWLTRILPRRRPARPPRFEPIDQLPAYLLYDIGLTRDRFDTNIHRRW